MIETEIFVGASAAHTPVADMLGTWWVAQCRPSYEKLLANDLRAMGIDCFLPLVKGSKVYDCGKKKYREIPLFPLYVFVNGDADARYEAARSRCTSQIIRVVNQLKLTRELSALELALAEDPLLGVGTDLRSGDQCRIRAPHKLEGIEGFLQIQDSGKRVFMLSVSILGKGTPLEIDPEYLERV